MVFGAGLLMCIGAVNASAQSTLSAQCRALTGLIAAMPDDAPGRVISVAESAKSDDMPAFCEASGYIAPQVRFAVRLPAKESWNGKLLFRGCGGMCGEVRIDRANDALKRGYATATTDMGHMSTPVDALWAYNNPSAELDFAHRATHVSTRAAKALIDAYYGRAPQKSYFQGCSTGGRQGLMAASRYPDDFDGVIAGAPIMYYVTGPITLLHATRSLTRADGAPMLSRGDLDLLAKAALDSCDDKDGAKDGVIEDPRVCTFDPARLTCSGEKSASCLSPEQVRAVRDVYAGPRDRRGRAIDQGHPMIGSEPNWAGSYLGDGATRPLYESFVGDVFRYLLFPRDPGPQWRFSDFDLDRDLPRMRAADALYSVRNPDLSAFAKRGGKLIMYHGWRDQSVLPGVSVDYYQRMIAHFGGAAQTQAFARLFMIPGMDHCLGGPGAWDIDPLSALEQWAEHGKAPDVLMGRFRDKERVIGERPHFAFPDTARRDGESWVRVAGEPRGRRTP
jgi:feruloyl esterase